MFSGSLKHNLRLTQEDVDSIAAYPYLGGLFGWVPGILNDRMGSRVACAAGCAGMAVSLVGYWAVATRRLLLPPVASLAALMLLVQWSNAGISAGMFSSLVKNFPLHRGVVAGIAKAWIGLCGGILTQLYVGFVGFPDNSPATLNFVLFMAFTAAFAGVVSMLIVVHPPRPEERALTLRLGGCVAAILCMATLITTSAMAEGDHHPYAVAIVVVLVSPVLTTFSWDRSCWERLLAWLRELRASEAAALQGNLQMQTAAPLARGGGGGEDEEEGAPLLQSEGSADAAAPSLSLPELTTGQVVQTADFWLFLFGASWLVGGGQVLSVNINQMCESRGYGEPCKSS